MYRITDSNIDNILSDGENNTVAFELNLPQSDIIFKLISAFANTKGGAIIIGYDKKNNNVVGTSHDTIDKLKSIISNTNYQKYCDIHSVNCKGKELVVLDIRKANTIIYAEGIAYARAENKVIITHEKFRSKYLKTFIEEIKFHNRIPKKTKVLELLDDLSTNPERILTPETKLYRSRIISDMTQTGIEPGFWGYGNKDSFVPPANLTRDLRANYRYIPYLYCANNPYTAVVEVRPRLGANVSIATISVNKKLTLLDFTLKSIPQKMTDDKRNLFSDISMLFSKPVTSDDDILDYIPTQYIAEYVKHLGYDGIAYRSSLTPELDEDGTKENKRLDWYNIVVFNYDKCSPIKSNIFNVVKNHLECEQIDDDSENDIAPLPPLGLQLASI